MHYADGHRTHLGASLLGHECLRYLWYVFRWVKNADHIDRDEEGNVTKDAGGRMMRLFNRGHETEPRFVTWLEGVGCMVHTHDDSLPLKDGLPQQFRISGVNGHYGGSLDAIIETPPSWGIGPVLGEFKSHSQNSFRKLVKDGVQVAKHQHYGQMCQYGAEYGFRYGLYCAVNKNDDDVWFEIVPLDWELGLRLKLRADRVINSPLPPEKIAANQTYKGCSYCDFRDVCHQGREYEKNCRSCAMAQPIAEKKWFCHGYQQVIPAEFIANGCPQWRAAR